MLNNEWKIAVKLVTCLSVLILLAAPTSAGEQQPTRLALNTKKFEFKEGFERRTKDILNTLKDNEVTRFRTYLEGLEQSYGLNETLKGNGPYTLFAPSDKAWDAMPADDRASLFANRKKLHQVLSYMIAKGKYKYDDLKTVSSLKSLEGGDINIQIRHGDLWVDNAMVSTTDILCTNGVIHVIDTVIMPKLDK